MLLSRPDDLRFSRVGLHLFATQHMSAVNVGLEQHQPTLLCMLSSLETPGLKIIHCPMRWEGVYIIFESR